MTQPTTPLHRALSPHLILLLAFGSSSAINYTFGLAMGWLLRPGDFGLLAFAQTIGLIAGLILHYGVPASLAAAIVGTAGRSRAALVRGAVLANLALAFALSGAILGLYALGPLRTGLESWTTAVIVALSLPFVAVISVAWGTAQGSERFGILALIVVAEVLCKAVTGGGLVLIGTGVNGAIAGLLIGAIVGAVLSAYSLIYRLDVAPGWSIRLPALGTTGAMFGSILGLVLLLNLDLVGLKLVAGSARTLTGYYQAAIILANAPYYLVISTIVTVLFAQLARLQHLPATSRLVGAALAMAITVAIPFEVILSIAPGTILGLFFPASYAPGAPALRLLAVGNSLLILVAILTTAFQATGRAKVAAGVLLPIAAVEPFALWFVVPRWHAVGAASVFVGASSLALLALGGAYLRALGSQLALPAALWIFKYVLAMTAGTLIGFIMVSLSASRDLALSVGTIGYVTVALALRLIHGLRAPTRARPRSPQTVVETRE